MSQKVGIVAIAPTGNSITIYLEDGSTMELSASSYQTKRIVDEVLPIVARKQVAHVDLDHFSLVGEIERKSNGVLRFFRRVKNVVKSAIGLENAGEIEALSERARKVLEQTPNTAPGALIHHPDELAAGETMVVAVGDLEIEGVEKLASQMEAAAHGSTKGLENFLRRLAAVAKERKHTADELLNFMKLGDLPIAEDGSIIAYKILRRVDTVLDGHRFDLVDPHTKRVSQRVGVRVEMPISCVDDDRRTLCSNGLHVARRDYIRGFSGDVVTLIRVAPEDVIAVPYNEPSKMRVRGYDILALIPDEGRERLLMNQPMTQNEESARLLGAAIAGQLPDPTMVVEITGHAGTGLRLIPLGSDQSPANMPSAPAEPVQALHITEEKRNKPEEPIEGLDAKSIAKAAAISGDLPAVPSVDPVAEQPKKKPMPPGVVKDQARLDAEAEALRLVKSGVSQREAARLTGVSARAIGRLLSKSA